MLRQSHWPVVLLASLWVGCNPPQEVQPSPKESPHSKKTGEPNDQRALETNEGEYVSFPSVGIRLRKPTGFEEETSFDGFGRRESQASVMPMKLQGPYSKVTEGFTSENMKGRGMEFIGKETVEVDGRSGLLIHFLQKAAGVEFEKWTLALGDEKQTILVTATFPKSLSEEMSPRLKAVLLAAKLDQDVTAEPGADVPFTIAASRKLKLTDAITKVLACTKDGVIPVKSPSDPMFVVAPALGKAIVDDRKKFAERHLSATAHTTIKSVTSTSAVTIDGLEGIETVAKGQDEKSGTPLIIYHVVLFEDDSYVAITGLVGKELADTYLPEFQELARSLKKKKPR